MANNTKSNRPKIGDLNLLAVMTTLRLDVAADYRRYMKEKREHCMDALAHTVHDMERKQVEYGAIRF